MNTVRRKSANAWIFINRVVDHIFLFRRIRQPERNDFNSRLHSSSEKSRAVHSSQHLSAFKAGVIKLKLLPMMDLTHMYFVVWREPACEKSAHPPGSMKLIPVAL